MRSFCVLGWLAASVVACGSGGGFPDAKPIDSPPPNATFTLAWTVNDANGQPVACDKISAGSVTVLAHNRAFDGGTTEVFTCATGMGQSQGLPPGTYDFDFQLTNLGGTLSTAPSQHGVVLTSGQNATLTPITFSVDATGGLALSLATNRTMGNCAAQPDGGGITDLTLTLVHTGDGTCAPVTLAISGGGTYAFADCTTPVKLGGCLDSTQTLTVSGVPSDNYSVHVKGYIGNNVCWTNNDTLQVPAQSMTLTKTLNLAYATGASGCP
jgi:hypothetical protein